MAERAATGGMDAMIKDFGDAGSRSVSRLSAGSLEVTLVYRGVAATSAASDDAADAASDAQSPSEAAAAD